MPKVLLFIFAAMLLLFTDRVSAQTAFPNRPPVDSAAMRQRAYKNIDSLTGIIRVTQNRLTLIGLYMRRATAESMVNKPDSAIHDYSRVLTLNPQVTEAYLWRGGQYQRILNYEAAIADDEKAIGFLRNYPMRVAEMYARIGYMQLSLKNYAKALAADSISLIINPNNGVAYENLALVYIQLKNYKKAIENIDACIPLQQARGKQFISNILANRADAKVNLKKYKEAVNDYLAAIQLNPDNKFALWNLGVAYSRNGDYQLSAAAYAKTITYYDGDDMSLAVLYTNKAQVEISIQKLDEALHDDSIALSHNSAYGPAYWSKANAYAQNGDFKLSIDWYMQTLKYYTDATNQATLNDDIAAEEFSLAHYDDAVQADTKAIELDARAWGSYLNRGRAYLKQGKKDQAMADFKRVLALDTTKRSNEYAFALFYTGNGDQAVGLMQSDIVSSNDPAVLGSHYYNLACLYSLMNKPDEANTYLKKCMDGGYSKKYAQLDPDLENIRGTDDFKAMMKAN